MKAERVLALARAALVGHGDEIRAHVLALADAEEGAGNMRVARRLRTLLSTQADANSPKIPPPTRLQPTTVVGSSAQDWPLEWPGERLADIFVPSDVAGQIDRVVDDLRNQDTLRAWGVSQATRALLHGPPGTGKTVTARAAVAASGRPIVSIELDRAVSSLLGETAQNIAGAFETAERAGAVVFLDELDAVLKSREDEHDVGELKRTVNAVLQILDRTRNTVPVLAATNHGFLLDGAVWRRFSDIIEFKAPTLKERKYILEKLLQAIPVASEVRVEAMDYAHITPGFTGSDLQRLLMNSARKAFHRGASKVEEPDIRSSHRESMQMVYGRQHTLERLREMSKVVDFHTQGLTFKEIARRTGLSDSTAFRRVRDAEEIGIGS